MIHWVDARLRTWGEWLQTNHGNGSKGLSANWEAVGGGGPAGAVIPIRSVEMSRTHDWVRTLGQADQALLVQVYCTPGTMRENAASLRMSLRTMYARLHQVHVAYAARPGHAPVADTKAYVAAPRRNRE